jgi:hypothetical protein
LGEVESGIGRMSKGGVRSPVDSWGWSILSVDLSDVQIVRKEHTGVGFSEMEIGQSSGIKQVLTFERYVAVSSASTLDLHVVLKKLELCDKTALLLPKPILCISSESGKTENNGLLDQKVVSTDYQRTSSGVSPPSIEQDMETRSTRRLS